MGESKDLKTGETTSYDVGGKKLILKPVTLGKMKKAMAVFQAKDADTFDMMIDHLAVILANGENEFATREWLEDNITLPIANQMINDMRRVNGMGEDFFHKGEATNGQQKQEVRDLTERTPTPSV